MEQDDKQKDTTENAYKRITIWHVTGHQWKTIVYLWTPGKRMENGQVP